MPSTLGRPPNLPFRLSPPRDRKLYRLVKKAEPISLVKGRSLYAAGDTAREVFLVQRGYMRLVLPAMDKGRPERTVGVALPWELFGDEAFTEGHRRYGAIAGATCTVFPLPKTGVLHGLKTARKSLDAYLDGVERELHRLRHAQGGSRGPTAAQRLAEVLLDVADRCGEPDGRRIEIPERLTHQVLADLAGSHRATVTTLLNDWLYDGILSTSSNGCVCIQKHAGLWALAGYDRPSEAPADPPRDMRTSR